MTTYKPMRLTQCDCNLFHPGWLYQVYDKASSLIDWLENPKTLFFHYQHLVKNSTSQPNEQIFFYYYIQSSCNNPL